jgi:two-component system chemotaxis response regulator CheY
MIIFTLNDLGHDIIEAEDGVDAMTKINSSKFDLVLTDLNMPNMNGIELITNVRQNPQNRAVPILMLTTESAQDKKEAGKSAGATGWIVKPFQPEKLIAVVNKVLR